MVYLYSNLSSGLHKTIFPQACILDNQGNPSLIFVPIESTYST